MTWLLTLFIGDTTLRQWNSVWIFCYIYYQTTSNIVYNKSCYICISIIYIYGEDVYAKVMLLLLSIINHELINSTELSYGAI